MPPLWMVAAQGFCIGAQHRLVDGADGALDVRLGRCLHALFRERPLNVVNSISWSCVMWIKALRPVVGIACTQLLFAAGCAGHQRGEGWRRTALQAQRSVIWT